MHRADAHDQQGEHRRLIPFVERLEVDRPTAAVDRFVAPCEGRERGKRPEEIDGKQIPDRQFHRLARDRCDRPRKQQRHQPGGDGRRRARLGGQALLDNGHHVVCGDRPDAGGAAIQRSLHRASPALMLRAIDHDQADVTEPADPAGAIRLGNGEDLREKVELPVAGRLHHRLGLRGVDHHERRRPIPIASKHRHRRLDGWKPVETPPASHRADRVEQLEIVHRDTLSHARRLGIPKVRHDRPGISTPGRQPWLRQT